MFKLHQHWNHVLEFWKEKAQKMKCEEFLKLLKEIEFDIPEKIIEALFVGYMR